MLSKKPSLLCLAAIVSLFIIMAFVFSSAYMWGRASYNIDSVFPDPGNDQSGGDTPANTLII